VLDGLFLFKNDILDDTATVDSTLSRFIGMKKGGEFYLAVADSGAGNTGTLRSWTVYTGGFEHFAGGCSVSCH
jgi:subtilisin-like proprotein convertase family protein